MTIAPLPIAVPLIVAAALAATDFVHRRRVTNLVAIATAATVTALCAILIFRSAAGPIVYWLGAWHPRHGVALGIALAVDPLGAAMATLAALLVTATLLYSVKYFDAVSNLFQALMLVFLAAMVGFCLTGDLFNLFVFFELMSVAAYALTAYKIEERGPLQGAINFAVSNSLGGIMALIGIALAYGRTGALNLAQIGEALAQRPPDALVAVAFALIVLGFLVKAAAFPVHFWLADAHAVAPTPVCVLFSGAMVELGVYGVARVWWSCFAAPLGGDAIALRPVFVWIGVLTALVGAVMCFRQRHLKRLLAFSTVSHVGIFLLCLGALSHIGIAALAAYVLAHGLAKGALFMCVGVLIHRFAEVDELRLRGCGRRDAGLLFVGVLFAASGIVLAGAPMIGAFLGKSLGEASVEEAGFGWTVAIFVVASGLTAGAVLRAAGSIFCGWGEDEPPGVAQPQEGDVEPETLELHDRTPATMVVPPALLTVAALLVSVAPGLEDAVQHAAAQFVQTGAYADAVLHGRNTFVALPTEGLKAADFVWGALSLLLALAVSGLALFGRGLVERVPERLRRAGESALQPLEAAQSGHPGDYVAWLTAGAGALCAVIVLALR
ncbi:MAG TPA: proton-conducting transporter membrane subunit [Solirubrobacterales bacterium]|nr:proton-conducting transporter membrane subunit [Solirubrobacterales bacterium]